MKQGTKMRLQIVVGFSAVILTLFVILWAISWAQSVRYTQDDRPEGVLLYLANQKFVAWESELKAKGTNAIAIRQDLGNLLTSANKGTKDTRPYESFLVMIQPNQLNCPEKTLEAYFQLKQLLGVHTNLPEQHEDKASLLKEMHEAHAEDVKNRLESWERSFPSY